MKLLKFILVVAIIGAAGFFSYKYWQDYIQDSSKEYTGIHAVNGRMEIKRIDVSSLYAGRVEEVNVLEGDEVSKGNVLVHLATDQSSAHVKIALAQKKEAIDYVERSKAEINALKEQIKLDELELNNATDLHRDSLISQTALERHKTSLAAKNKQLDALQNALAAAQAEVERADAAVEQAKSADQDMIIKAPIDGYVEYRLVEPGNVVGAGGKVISILNPSDVSMDIFIPSYEVSRVKTGDEGRIVIEGIDAVFPAKISYVARDAQFTPKFVETKQERSKMLFRVTLRITAETALHYKKLLKGGMTAIGYVNYANVKWPAELAVKLPVFEE